MGEQIGAALVAEVLGERPASLSLDTDTQEPPRELGVPATSVAQWAKTQDCEAAPPP